MKKPILSILLLSILFSTGCMGIRQYVVSRDDHIRIVLRDMGSSDSRTRNSAEDEFDEYLKECPELLVKGISELKNFKSLDYCAKRGFYRYNPGIITAVANTIKKNGVKPTNNEKYSQTRNSIFSTYLQNGKLLNNLELGTFTTYAGYRPSSSLPFNNHNRYYQEKMINAAITFARATDLLFLPGIKYGNSSNWPQTGTMLIYKFIWMKTQNKLDSAENILSEIKEKHFDEQPYVPQSYAPRYMSSSSFRSCYKFPFTSTIGIKILGIRAAYCLRNNNINGAVSLLKTSREATTSTGKMISDNQQNQWVRNYFSSQNRRINPIDLAIMRAQFRSLSTDVRTNVMLIYLYGLKGETKKQQSELAKLKETWPDTMLRFSLKVTKLLRDDRREALNEYLRNFLAGEVSSDYY